MRARSSLTCSGATAWFAGVGSAVGRVGVVAPWPSRRVLQTSGRRRLPDFFAATRRLRKYQHLAIGTDRPAHHVYCQFGSTDAGRRGGRGERLGRTRVDCSTMADPDPELRRKLFQQGRLWLLSLVCATAGAATVWATNSLPWGVLAFLICLAVLGPLLWLYERRRR